MLGIYYQNKSSQICFFSYPFIYFIFFSNGFHAQRGAKRKREREKDIMGEHGVHALTDVGGETGWGRRHIRNDE